MFTKEDIEKIKEIGLFDFIARHYWERSKDDLAFIAKEYNFAVYQLDKNIEQKATDMLLELMQEKLDEEEIKE